MGLYNIYKYSKSTDEISREDIVSCLYKKSLKIPKGGNQNQYIEEQTTQWQKEKVQKDKQ